MVPWRPVDQAPAQPLDQAGAHPLTALFRTATFRLTLGASAILICVTLLQFALIYWRTSAYEVERADRLLDREAALLVAQSPDDLREQMRLWATNDLRLLITAAGLFDADRRPLAGNLTVWPEALPVDGAIREITVHPVDQPERVVRAEALPLPGGRFLVIGRGLRDLQQIRGIVLEAIETCLIPALVFSLVAGLWLSRRALVRVGAMQRAIDLIMQGDLHERLPTGRLFAIGQHSGDPRVTSWGGSDEMDRLASSVNRMLERQEHLLSEIRGVGDDIAHDLRTPLSRVRASLERASQQPLSADELRTVIARAIADLDQSFVIITALLRIGEIENGQRRAGFSRIELGGLVADLVELYEPLAESAGHRLVLECHEPVMLLGDRDLIVELAANLIDNAIKFTPDGGLVRAAVTVRDGRPMLIVSDNGIGVAPEERNAVLRRFFRSDKSRHIRGSGLGLSLVNAIAGLHDATVSIGNGDGPADRPGAAFEVVFAAG